MSEKEKGPGDLPDPRMRAHAARRGYLLEHRSRPVQPDDFDRFDLILGMDDYNIDTLRSMADTPATGYSKRICGVDSMRL